MNVVETRAKIIDEIAAFPDDKLAAIYDLLCVFRSPSVHNKSKNKSRRVALVKKLYDSARGEKNHAPTDLEVGDILDEARSERFGVM